VSYKKLWKLLIDKEMTYIDLRNTIGTSSSTFARLSRNECIFADLISRICTALRSNVDDIIDIMRNDGMVKKCSDFLTLEFGTGWGYQTIRHCVRAAYTFAMVTNSTYVFRGDGLFRTISLESIRKAAVVMMVKVKGARIG
jgi:DNA-binding Xre family transcriptional regulator